MDQFFTNNPSSIVASNRILYTPSPFARKSLLHLQEIGEFEAKRRHTSSRSKLSSFLFFTVASGSGELVYNEKQCKLKSGDCVFIDCEKAYSHTTDPNNLWTLRWIHFYGSVMSSIYDKYCEHGGRSSFHPSESNDEELGKVWQMIFSTASGDDYMRDMLINQHLLELLTLIMSESWHPEDQGNLPQKKSIVLPVKEYLDKNYGSKITLDGLATRFCINKYYLTKNFREQYGQSITAYLLNVRITKAKQLLRFTDKTVEEISIECGL